MTYFLASNPQATSHMRALLSAGNLCGLPTETVYGLAGNGYDDHAISRIFALKKRPTFNPLILHYGDEPTSQHCLYQDVLWTETADKLAEAFWPGPLTLILERHPDSKISPLACAGLETVAVRVPLHPFTGALLNTLPFPLAMPSANPSGYLSPTQAYHVQKAFPELPLVDGGECSWGLESTVVDLSAPEPRLLREGSLSVERIERILAFSLTFPDTSKEQVAFHSPGLLPSHYAPSKPLRLNAHSINSDEGLLAFGPHVFKDASYTLNLSPEGNMVEAARHLFDFLHQLDAHSCARIAVMPIPMTGLGSAINDRLLRAAAPQEPSHG